MILRPEADTRKVASMLRTAMCDDTLIAKKTTSQLTLG